VASMSPGSEASFKVLRQGRSSELTVKIAERPSAQKR